jgi:uncharacterized repeat protein (TIGR01451 family)
MRFISSIALQRCQGLLSFRPLGHPGKKVGSILLLAFFTLWSTGVLQARPAGAPERLPSIETGLDWTALSGMSIGDFNASISANPTTVTAGNSVLYTINYSTGAVASNINGAKIRVFIPVPVLNGGLISFNGTLDVASTSLTATAGGYNFDIIFINPLPAGSQGMLELTVTYPVGSLCNGTVVSTTVTATTVDGPSDNNPNDNTANVTVNDMASPWTINVITDNIRTLGQISNYRVQLNRVSSSNFNINGTVIKLAIPKNATVSSCDACTQIAGSGANPDTLRWGPANYSSNQTFNVNLIYNTPTFAVGNTVTLTGSFRGTNPTCNTILTGTDTETGVIPPPPPPAPNVACVQPTLSTTVIGSVGTTNVSYSNSGNVDLSPFTVTVDFPNEVQITQIPAGIYTTGGLNVNVSYFTSAGGPFTYSFVTSNMAGTGGQNLAAGTYLTKITYSFVSAVPAGFMPSSPLVFNYTVVATTIDGMGTANGANPRIPNGNCTVCNNDNPNGSGFSCLEVKLQVNGTYNASNPSQTCAISQVARDPNQGPENIDKTVDLTQVYPRDTVTFSLKFDHCGVNPFVNGNLVDVLPSQFTYITGSSKWQGAAFANPSNVANTLTWTLPNNLPGDQVANANNFECTTYTLTFRARVNDMTLASTLNNCFTVNGTVPANPDAMEFCTASDFQDCQTVQVLPVGPNSPNKIFCQDLTAPTNKIFPEDLIQYKLQWRHNGNFNVTNVLLLDTLPAQYAFVPGTVVYSANIQTLLTAYQVSNPGFQPFTSTAISGGRTLLKWNFSTMLFPGNGAQFDITYRVNVKQATPPGSVSNCFSVEGFSVIGQGNNVRIDSVTDCDNLSIEPVGPINSNKAISVTDGTVLPTEEFYYTLQFNNSGPFNVTNLRISDILPTYLELIQSEAIIYTNLPAPTSYSYNPVTRALNWVWTNVAGADPGTALSNLKEIRYKVRVKAGTPAGTVFNNCFRIDGQGPNIDPRRITTPAGSAENENLSPYLQQACSSNLSVLTLAVVRSRKGVKGVCDNDFVYFNPDGSLPPNLTNLNGIGRTFAGGDASYRLQIFNPGNITIEKVILIDILPFVGDKGVLRTDEARLTEWRPTLAAPIVAPAGIKVFYSYEQNPCRTEFNPGISPAGCTGPNWTLTPADLSLVQSVKLDFSSVDILPADTFSIDWKMFAPYNTPVNQIAWNSFAFQGRRKDNQNLFLTAEPNKVGIAVKPDPRSELGNYVWVDRNQNGLQDEPLSEGVNNIKVTLFKSTDLIKGNGDDMNLGSVFTGFDIQAILAFICLQTLLQATIMWYLTWQPCLQPRR